MGYPYFRTPPTVNGLVKITGEYGEKPMDPNLRVMLSTVGGSPSIMLNCQWFDFTLWLFNIAMENGPFIDDFPINTSIYKGFSMAMLNNQMVSFFLLEPLLGFSLNFIQVCEGKWRRFSTATAGQNCIDWQHEELEVSPIWQVGEGEISSIPNSSEVCHFIRCRFVEIHLRTSMILGTRIVGRTRICCQPV